MQYWGSAGYCFGSFSFHPEHIVLLVQRYLRYRIILKYSDDTAVVECVHGGQEKEYRDLVESFYGWTKKNCLLLNTTKTKELVVDFRRSKNECQSVWWRGARDCSELQIPGGGAG